MNSPLIGIPTIVCSNCGCCLSPRYQDGELMVAHFMTPMSDGWRCIYEGKEWTVQPVALAAKEVNK